MIEDSMPSLVTESPEAPLTGAPATAGRRHLSWDLAMLRRAWSRVAIPFWVSASRIGGGAVFAHLVVVLLPQSRQHLSDGSLSAGTWAGAFDRWDSAHYLGIAQHGYRLDNVSQTAFFPGYSLLVAAVHALSLGGLTYLQSSLAVSWIALVAASILLYQLAARLFGLRVALIATVLFCWFPASLFFLAPYSEALFALEIVAVLSLVERRCFLAAACVAAYASATSPESVALTVALVLAALLAGRGLWRILSYGVVSITGIAAYMVYLWARFRDPFEFKSVQQKFWGRSEDLPFVGLFRNLIALHRFFVGPGPTTAGTLPTYANIKWIFILDDASLIVATALSVALFAMWLTRARRHEMPLLRPSTTASTAGEDGPIPVTLVVLAAIIVLIAACTSIPWGPPGYASTEGEARFVSIAIPLYMSGALVIRRYPSLICVAIGGSVIAALLFQALFNLDYWVT
jgi:hypothetical protein